MKLLICPDCRAMMGFVDDEFEIDELFCRPCAVKKYGEAYLLDIENNAEEYKDDNEIH
jgi:hypothetical protein